MIDFLRSGDMNTGESHQFFRLAEPRGLALPMYQPISRSFQDILAQPPPQEKMIFRNLTVKVRFDCSKKKKKSIPLP